MKVVTITTGQKIAVAAIVAEQIGLAAQRPHLVEILMALVTLMTYRIAKGPDTEVHIAVNSDTVARTAKA